MKINISKERIITRDIEQDKIILKIIIESKINEMILDAVYTPDMDSNLLSMFILLEKDFEISMKPHIDVKILKDEVLIIDIIKDEKIFRLKTIQYLAAKITKNRLMFIENIRI